MYSLYPGNVNHSSVVKHKKGYKRLVRKHVWIRDWQSHTSFLGISWQRARSAQNVSCDDSHGLLVTETGQLLFSHIILKITLRLVWSFHMMFLNVTLDYTVCGLPQKEWLSGRLSPPGPRLPLLPSLIIEEKKNVLTLKHYF